MKRYYILGSLALLFGIVVACAQPEPTPTPTATSTPLSTATVTPLPTDTSKSIPEPTPTPTPTTTPTPLPTATPTLTPTHTPTLLPTHTPTQTGLSTPLPTPTFTPSPAVRLAAVGGEIFLNVPANAAPQPLWCYQCHWIQGVSTGLIGPDLTNIGTTAATRIPGMTAEQYIEESIKDPEAFIAEGVILATPGLMTNSSVRALTDEQVEALVTFLLTQKVGVAP